MHMDWVKLTDCDNGQPIFVNLANALTIQRGNNCSWIWFPTGSEDEDNIEVVETPEQILQKLKESRGLAG